ncbi:unnamed protein product [Schistosoma haematobium]|nr:unnamed protein product [Schistosoma haematobium]
MKACLMQAAVIFIYYLGVQYLVTADNASEVLDDVYFKLKVYTESIYDLQQEKLYAEQLLPYEFQGVEKPFRDEVMRLEKLYAAKWILDLLKNITPNDANLLQTYSENYERLSDIKTNSGLDDYFDSLIESVIEKKWNARLDFDLATNIYLNMKTSSKSSSLTENNGKSLDERKSTLGETENQYKESKLRVISTNKELIETNLAFSNFCDAVKKDLPKLHPHLEEMQKNISEMTEHLDNYTRDIRAVVAKAKNTSDPIQRHNLEREVDDLWLIISDYKNRIYKSEKNLDEAINDVLFANLEVIAEQDKKRNVTIRNEDATYDHLKTLTNMEVQRIDVLELLSLEERIKIYESIMQEEINSI